MSMKIHQERGGYVVHEVSGYNGMHTITLKDEKGEVLDKMRCDTPSQARDYARAFRAVAKARGAA